MPFSKKKVHYNHVTYAMPRMKQGDFILTRTNGELTTLLIPGQYKHAAVYVGAGTAVEAISPSVTTNSLIDVLMRSDSFAIMRLKDCTDEEGRAISFKAYQQIGKEYDFGLKILDESSMYCSEVIYRCVDSVRKGYVELRYRLGYPTFTPDDCRKSSKFELIYEKTA